MAVPRGPGRQAQSAGGTRPLREKEMSEESYPSAEEVTNRVFGITMAGVIAFIVVVFAFIIL